MKKETENHTVNYLVKSDLRQLQKPTPYSLKGEGGERHVLRTRRKEATSTHVHRQEEQNQDSDDILPNNRD